jgi:hypothetical protein
VWRAFIMSVGAKLLAAMTDDEYLKSLDRMVTTR